MWLLGKKTVYDRSRILGEAQQARSRKKYEKAIALYRQVLEVEPENVDLLGKIAPLLARARHPAEVRSTYRSAAEGLVRRGFVDRAIGTLREATGYLPRDVEIWSALAALELKRGRPIDAHRTLLQGRSHFRRRKDRPQAIELLRRARELAPKDFETSFDLAGLLARSGQRARAHSLLEELVRRSGRRELRRVRARQLRVAPSPAAGWRWLRALLWTDSTPGGEIPGRAQVARR